MFLLYISNVDAFGQGRCDRNVFDLDFPLWFYALVSLAGLLLLPWFHLIGCIVFKIISKAASSLNLNRMHGHHSANRTTLDWNSILNTEPIQAMNIDSTQKTKIQHTIITQPETINTESTSDYGSYSHVPTHLIQQRNPVHSEHQQHSVCSEFNSD